MTLNQLNSAAMRAYRTHTKSSYSLLACIADEASKAGLSEDAVQQQFEKLYPGLLHPLTRTKEIKRKKETV